MIRRKILILTVFLLLAGIIPTFASEPALSNLALHKTVISGTGSFCNSSSETAAKAVDGNTGTKWCHSGADWLQVDLGATYNLSNFVLTNNSEMASYITKDYSIQTSTDGSTWTTVVNVTDNTKIIVTSNINTVMARFVKLNVINPTQGGGGALRINEFEVYGDPSPLVNAATPSINTQPMGATVNQGDSSPTLSVTTSLSDEGIMEYQWFSNTTDINSGGSAIIGATSTSYAAPTNAAGKTYYYVVVTNKNMGATGSQTAQSTSSVALVNVLKITPPAPTGSFIIANGASVINTATVSLALARSSADVIRMRFSDDGQTWSVWENFSATKSYTMPSGDGLKLIFMELQDTDSQVNTELITNSILLDTIAPDAPVITLSTTEPTQEVTVTIEYSSDTVYKQYQMWGDNPATYTGPFVLTGNRTISAYATDAAGNRKETVLNITNIDHTPPTVTALINNGALWTKEADVMLKFDDGGSGATQMRFSNDNVTWSEWEPYSGSRSYSLPASEDGAKTIYMQFQDIFVNIGPVNDKTITLDRIAPVITIDSYNGTTLTNNDITVHATTNEGFLNETSHTFKDNGTFDFIATDMAGNVTTQRITITNIDKIAPITTANITVNSTTKYVTIHLNATDNGGDSVTSYYSVDGVQQTGNIILLKTQGTHLITYWSVDSVGNMEALNSKVVKVEILQMNSHGEFHIGDIVSLIEQGTLQQQDMNGDHLFDNEDIRIMLEAITPISD